MTDQFRTKSEHRYPIDKSLGDPELFENLIRPENRISLLGESSFPWILNKV